MWINQLPKFLKPGTNADVTWQKNAPHPAPRMKVLKLAVSGLALWGLLFVCVWSTKVVSVDHWGYAISVNFLFIAFFTIIFESVIEPSASCGYFETRAFERGGRIYTWFGVTHYARVLRLIGWERIIGKGRPITNDLGDLKRYEAWTRGSEAIHLLAALCVAGLTVWAGWGYSIGHIGWLVVVNSLVNLYPLMLQRFNRPRVLRLIEFDERRRSRGEGPESS